MEDTHLTDSERLSRLFALLTIAEMLGLSYWSMAVTGKTNQHKKAWPQSEEYFSLCFDYLT